jgi:hypothetical protein
MPRKEKKEEIGNIKIKGKNSLQQNFINRLCQCQRELSACQK